MARKQTEVFPVLNTTSVELTEEIIRQRAYELYEQRGFEHGHDMDDWLQAEAEVAGKKPSSAADPNTKADSVAAA